MAPVETIQSTKPALMSGTMEEQPRTDGGRERERGATRENAAQTPVTSGSSIFPAKSWHPSLSRAPLYARNALSTRSASFSLPVRFLGRIRLPERYWSRLGHVFFLSQSGISDRSLR